MSDTWIKLSRSLNDWEWKERPLTLALWIHILTNVNFKPSRYQGHEIPVGSMVAGVSKLSERTGLSPRQVRTALEHLKQQEVTIKTTNKFSIISVTKWKEYQEGDKQPTIKRQTNDKQPTTSKEGKKERRKEVLGYTKNFEAFWSAWKPFDMPKGNKQPASVLFEKQENQDQIIQSAKRYIADCHEKKCKTQHAQTWLNQRGWESWESEQEALVDKTGWEDWQEALASRIGEKAVQSWFLGCKPNGSVFYAKNKFAADYIKTHYSGDLEAVFGKQYEIRESLQ